METRIQILHLEDNALDAELIQERLDSANIASQITRVQTSIDFGAALQKGGYDLILADYQLPGYDGVSALNLAQENRPDIPFIFVSGTLGEDAAISALTKGAIDYVTKQKLSRLAPAITRALREAEDRVERRRAEEALQKNNALLERIFSSTEFMIAYLDADFNFIRVNRAYAEADNQMPEFFIGKNHFALYPNDENEAIFRRVVETGEMYMVYAKPFVYPEHPERGVSYLNWTLQPIKEADGRVSGLLFSLVDVTEREKAIIAQRESDALYRSLVEQASDGIFVTDPQGRFIDVNPSGSDMLGYTHEEILTLNMADMAPPESRSELPARLFELKPGSMFTAERMLVKKGGSVLPVEISGKALENGNLLGIVRDITERKRVEEALRESERRLIEAQRIAHVGYWERNFEAGQMILSDEACRIFGLLPQEVPLLLEEWHQRWLELIHPEDRLRTSKAAADVLAGGPPYNVEYRIIRPDGELRFIHSEASVRCDESGHPRYMLGMMQDITEHKMAENALRESEVRYHEIFDNVLDGLYLLQVTEDGHYLVMEVNPAVERISGLSFSNCPGKTPEEILPAEVAVKVNNIFRHCVESGFPIEDVAELDLPVGRRIIHSTLIPAQDETGRVRRIVGISRDVTERKHHELERDSIITVSTKLRQATTKSDILSVILDQLMALFKADGAVLVLPDPQTRGLIDEMGRGPVGERMIGLTIPPDTGIASWVIKNKQPYLNNRADQDPIFYRPDLLGESHCLAAVPLVAQEQAVGALWIACHTAVTEQDLGLLTAIADIAANAIHRVTLHEQTEQQLRHLMALHQIDVAISANFDLNVTLKVILKNVKDELDVDAASILLLNPVTHTLDYAAGDGFRTHNIENSHVQLGHGYAGRAAQTYRTVFSNDLTQAPGTFSRSILLAAEEFVSHFATPMIVKGQVKGVLEVFHRESFDTHQEWLDYFEILATQAAIAIENASLFENLQRSNLELRLAYDATIEGWSRALDLRDRETEGHTQRVTEMVLELAEKMGMNDAEKMDLKRGALLHDIGKMGIPDSILLKPGPLSETEWEWMRKHPVYAFEMLSPIPYLKRALDVPYCHHEKWDGSGYPRGLKGEAIPLSARLFAIVDVFDALTSNRPYRAAWSPEKVYRYIQEQSGISFDPQIVKIFVREME